MTAYVFETMTPAQAAAYDGAADSLTIQTAGLSAARATVAYVAAPEQAAVSVNGVTLNFGAGIFGDTDIRFPDGSMLFVGGSGADSPTGTGFADGLFGGQGADSLSGGAGGDLLQGNQGADSLSAGADGDFVYGGQGDDTIDVGDGSNFGQGNLGNDTVSASGAGRNTLLGGQGNDAITGGGGDDFLNGNLGDDSVSGGAGADTLSGEGGVDTLDGGAGVDVFIVNGGASDATQAGADRIVNWSSEDLIDVPGAGGFAAYYLIPSSMTSPGGAPSDPYGYGSYDPGMTPTTGSPTYAAYPFAQALNTANGWIQGHPANTVVTAQIDEGVAIFLDTNGDRAVDATIILVGKSIADVSAANFI